MVIQSLRCAGLARACANWPRNWAGRVTESTADSGGSNGSRVRLWKLELQKLADEIGLLISVCHLPPGTSKWNKIEHRLFSFISQNWRGKPLVSHEVIVNLISATTTQTGLKVRAKLDTNSYRPEPRCQKSRSQR